MLATVIYPCPETVDHDWMENALGVIDGLVESGHVSARYRNEEIKRLHEMIKHVAGSAEDVTTDMVQEEVDGQIHGQHGLGAIDGISSTDMLSIADLMGQYPTINMDPGMLGGDWLWEDNFAQWRQEGDSLLDETGQSMG